MTKPKKESKSKKPTSVPAGNKPPAANKPKQKRRPRITAADYALAQQGLAVLAGLEREKAVSWAKSHLMVNGEPFSGNYAGLQSYCSEQGVSIGTSTTLAAAEDLIKKLDQYT